MMSPDGEDKHTDSPGRLNKFRELLKPFRPMKDRLEDG
jgi:hypothetical protein